MCWCIVYPLWFEKLLPLFCLPQFPQFFVNIFRSPNSNFPPKGTKIVTYLIYLTKITNFINFFLNSSWILAAKISFRVSWIFQVTPSFDPFLLKKNSLLFSAFPFRRKVKSRNSRNFSDYCKKTPPFIKNRGHYIPPCYQTCCKAGSSKTQEKTRKWKVGYFIKLYTIFWRKKNRTNSRFCRVLPIRKKMT